MAFCLDLRLLRGRAVAAVEDLLVRVVVAQLGAGQEVVGDLVARAEARLSLCVVCFQVLLGRF